jgi:hypothetical protein
VYPELIKRDPSIVLPFQGGGVLFRRLLEGLGRTLEPGLSIAESVLDVLKACLSRFPRCLLNVSSLG